MTANVVNTRVVVKVSSTRLDNNFIHSLHFTFFAFQSSFKQNSMLQEIVLIVSLPLAEIPSERSTVRMARPISIELLVIILKFPRTKPLFEPN